MSEGPGPSGAPRHGRPSGSSGESGTPVGKGWGAVAGTARGSTAEGLETPKGALPLWGREGVSVGQEKAGCGKEAKATVPPKIWRGARRPLGGLGSLAGRQHPPSPWAVVGVLAVGLLACLFLLFHIHAGLQSLREELGALRREAACRASGMVNVGETPDSRQRLAGGPEPAGRRARWTRDARRKPQDQQGHSKKHSVLHLIPVRQSNNEEGDATEIAWSPFLHQGRALQARGQEVVVKRSGLYFVYSQVLFHDPTFTMGQVLRRVSQDSLDQILFRCVQSMPSKLEKAYNSCYSGGVFHLQQGDRLSLRIPRFNASFDISSHGTFLGVLRL